MGTQIWSNEGPNPFPREDNYEIAKYIDEILKSLSLELLSRFQSNLAQTSQGERNLRFALAKTTSYRKLHEVHVPSQFTAKFASSKDKFLLIKNYSQKEEGLMRIAESSMVIWYSLYCFLDVFSFKNWRESEACRKFRWTIWLITGNKTPYCNGCVHCWNDVVGQWF